MLPSSVFVLGGFYVITPDVQEYFLPHSHACKVGMFIFGEVLFSPFSGHKRRIFMIMEGHFFLLPLAGSINPLLS